MFNLCPPVDPAVARAALEAGNSCVVADFNGDGFRDPDDLNEFITAFFLNQPCADLDGNGTLEAQDLTLFIVAFFEAVLAGC